MMEERNAVKQMKILAKVVLAGDGGVGKTTLVHRYLTNSFIDSTKITIGAAFHSHTIEKDGHKIILQIWDLGGQQQFKRMGIFKRYFKGASITVLMFDLSRLTTLESLDEWADLATSSSDCHFVLVGGKKDLARDGLENERVISELNESYPIHGYVETSSATGEGVDEVFDIIAEILLASLNED
jgi:small GTP-binding protein